MKKEPTCPLCAGRMERHEEVPIQVGGVQGVTLSLAWVCTGCSAAFPIAVGEFGMFKKPRPLYGDAGPGE